MRNRCLSLVFVVGLLVTSGIAGASAAMAQSAATQQQPAITDQDIKTFAVAAKEVQRINQAYVPAYQSAQTDEQRRAIEQEAMTKMADAVKEKGLTVDKYNQIVQAAQADPEVARQIDSHARQAQ